MDGNNEHTIADQTDTDVDGLPSVDLDAELAEIHAIERHAEGFLMFGAEMVPFRIDQRGRDGMIGSCVGTLALEDTEEIHFPANEACPGGVLVIAPVRTTYENGITRIWVRYLTGFATSEAALLHLVSRRLWLAELGAHSIIEQDDGWLFDFSEARREKPNLKDRIAQLNREADRQNRASIRQTVGWWDELDNGSGMAYRISAQAVTIMADERLPREGSEVTINFPMNHGSATVRGLVAWVMPAGAGNHAGAFTVNIEHVEDGDNGRSWQVYIDELLVLSNRPF